MRLGRRGCGRTILRNIHIEPVAPQRFEQRSVVGGIFIYIYNCNCNCNCNYNYN